MRRVMWVLVWMGCNGEVGQTCPNLNLPSEVVPVSAQPFLQLRRNYVRLRFETPDLVSVPVSLSVPGVLCPQVVIAESERLTRTWAKPEDPASVEWPDVAGEYTLHTADLTDLESGVDASWTVHAGPDDGSWFTGTVSPLAALDEPATVAIMGSLAPTVQGELATLLAGADLTILAGDLTETDEAASTYAQLAADVFPHTASGVVHTVPGDRDDVQEAAMEELYRRWFEGQGRAGRGDRYYAVDLAGVRFLFLDGEDDRLSVDGARQFKWVQSELTIIGNDPDLREAIVVLHRGPYSLTEQVPNASLRDAFVPMLRAGGVRLLIAGDGRAYERFEADGLTVINDGGGGAALGNVDHRVERDPDALALRETARASHGGLRLEIAGDGALTLERLALDGSSEETLNWPAPP